MGGDIFKVLVLSGGKQIFQACEMMLAGQLKPDIVEVMACQGGCQNGGGMPKCRDYRARGKGMDCDDAKAADAFASANQSLLSHGMTHGDIEDLYERAYQDKSGEVFQ